MAKVGLVHLRNIEGASTVGAKGTLRKKHTGLDPVSLILSEFQASYLAQIIM
jgi:hypothetical protein